MAGEIEGLGDLATGALMAQAVDRHGHAHAGAAGHGACLNCGTTLIGEYCYACGQAAHLHRSIGAIWHDLLHGVLHFEGRMWATLPMLIRRPGELTRRYIEGERAKFVSPMAMFLFSVFTLFAVLSILGIAPPADVGNATGKVASGLEEAKKELVSTREVQLKRLNDPQSTDARKARARERLAEIDRELKVVVEAQPVFKAQDEYTANFKTGWKRLDYGIEKATKNPGLALYKLQANSYKFSWLLIPLSVPFVWLLFAWKRQFHAYDHAVFVTYSLAFMSLLFIVLTILGAFGVWSGGLFLAATLIPPFHIYRQLRGAYRLGRASALARTLVLLVFVQVIATLFLVLVLGLGLIG
ncbi:hypothetical protein COC42_02505 [Sphingomonas spermidinifaciens]|uniref:DUF3667 domain-containing protein n=1 Tax=Sphingomonas spermidinifaciens TaxID=1141889 RepID=A0A2A4B6M8_9SPHN|nr:DUF3667 domain-containing protein [Sphingomonas spermidinifaciens]PCD03296.1 hypothetical protein COC42_02505 [Sphingomonas spermidinifaciens]